MLRFMTSSLSFSESFASCLVASLVRALLTASIVELHVFSAESAFDVILASSCLASNIGPFEAPDTAACCSVTLALTSATSFLTCAASFSAACKIVKGSAIASSLASSTDANTFAPSANFCRLASMSSTFSTTDLRSTAAAFLSRASCCVRFATSTRFEYSFFASVTFFFSSCTCVCASAARGLSFVRSALASLRGPCVQLASSADLDLTKPTAFPALFHVISSSRSMAFTKASWGENGSKYNVPWFPFVVTHPVTPLAITLHSTLCKIPPFASLGSPTNSTTSSTSNLATVLLEEISKQSVIAILLTHV
mmetsp:Transcript_88906/g.140473  ORF Transcript_88906/g.140473 Transcript_88906/m.140473 type:complete len:310 (-) Transcript_88906:479-1408(-)